MKYTIFGLQQDALIEYGLTLNDALLLERLIFLTGLRKFKTVVIDDAEYTWVSYSLLHEEIPIVLTSEDKATRMFKNLETKGIIQRRYHKGHNITKVFFRINPEVSARLVTPQNCGVTKKNPVTPQKCGSGNTAELRSDSSGISSGSIPPKKAVINDSLYKRAMDHFVKKHGENYANYAKEGKALVKLLSLVNNDESRLYRIVKRFYELTKSSDRYYSKLEFSPSKLLANYDNVVKLVREDLAYEEGR